MASGGYHPPAKPAPVSGPGAHSKRTDAAQPHQAISAVPDQGYGEAGQQMAAQHIAPMGGATPMPNAPSAGAVAAAAQQAPMYTAGDFARPSERPNEPVTHGVPIGPGSNEPVAAAPQAPPVSQGTGYVTNLLQSAAAQGAAGSSVLAQLADMAAARNA